MEEKLVNTVKKDSNLSGVDLATSLSLLISTMYLCGYLYHAGYLGGYKIIEGHFELTVEGYLLKFFLLFIQLFSEILKFTGLYEILAVSGFILMYGFFLYGVHAARFVIKAWIQCIKERLFRGKKLDWLGMPLTFTGVVVGVPLLVMGILAFIVLIILSSYSVGSHRAAEDIKSFIPCNSAGAKCTKVFSGVEMVAEGFVIEVSDRAVAIYDGTKAIVLENQNLRFETQPK